MPTPASSLRTPSANGTFAGRVIRSDSGAKLPFKKTTTIGPDVHLLQVVATGRDDPGPGCKITLNGKVVAQEPVGGSAHCIFSLP